MASIFLSGFADTDLTFHSTSGPSCNMEPEIGNWNGQYRLTRRASTDLDDESEDAQAAFFWLALLCISPFDIILQRQGRRFWTVLRGSGVWKEYFQSICPQMAVLYNVTDWENKEYKRHLRMSKVAFWKLNQKYGKYLRKKDTRFRKAIPSETRLAITIHFLAHAVDFETLALLYVVGKSTVVTIVHNTVTVLYHRMMPDSIRFPTATGKNLRTTMEDFETVPGGGLVRCAGAIDGTFIKIIKPKRHGDSYWCYKKHLAIILLTVVDARGRFAFISVGRPGSAGDAATYHGSLLK